MPNPEQIAENEAFNVETVINKEVDLLRKLREQKDEDGLIGLALSGGGIRSATFNLGVLQAMATLGLLKEVDYLSTVSGGGYIGAWLTAQIKRRRQYSWFMGPVTDKEHIRDAREALKKVEDELAEKPEPLVISFLRSYSNYLTPKAGLLSTDTLAAVAILLRNIFLAQVILAALLVALLLTPRLLFCLYGVITAAIATYPLGFATWLVLAAVGLLLIVAVSFIAIQLAIADGNLETQAATDSKALWGWLVLPLLLSSLAIAGLMNENTRSNPFLFNTDLANLRLCSIGGALAFGVVGLFVGIWLRLWRGKRSSNLGFVERAVLSFAPFLAGAFGGWLFYWLGVLFSWANEQHEAAGRWLALGLGTVVVLKIFSLVAVLHIGLVSRGFTEQNREWWGRLGGIILMLGLAWVGLFAAAVLAPALWVWANYWIISLGGVGWLLSTAAGIWLGRSETSGKPGEGAATRYLGVIAPYVFMVGLLILLSVTIDYANNGITSFYPSETPLPASSEVVVKYPLGGGVRVADDNTASVAEGGSGELTVKSTVPGGKHLIFSPPARMELRSILLYELCAMSQANSLSLWIAFASCLLIFLLLGWRVDVNLFSMHHFYRNRLARCYLGASNAERKPSPFTGFDPIDDVDLAGCVQRPYPIINTAINLVRSSELAWQQRKAGSFVFTPHYSGFWLKESKGDVGGFRETSGYMKGPEYENGVKLGTAFAISGAAASPNMGYHSSPAMAFLMTVFNVRLGRWCGNTSDSSSEKQGNEAWSKLSPAFGGKYLIKELLGQTNENSPFVYLSDGGHFENIGIYELVRRQCRYIIACDAVQDHDINFEDLGNAIRKCYTDFGVTIELDATPLKPEPGSRYSRQHCVVGKIHYRQGPAGTLVYLKATLTGDEPTEILQYAYQTPSFPHRTTADQWFDETQFESYRALGEHIARGALEQAKQDSEGRQPR